MHWCQLYRPNAIHTDVDYAPHHATLMKLHETTKHCGYTCLPVSFDYLSVLYSFMSVLQQNRPKHTREINHLEHSCSPLPSILAKIAKMFTHGRHVACDCTAQKIFRRWKNRFSNSYGINRPLHVLNPIISAHPFHTAVMSVQQPV